ncbi:OsmC-related (seleno)protein [Hoeflea sp. TYP-13]|uniref:OsmC-related (seleno)protein n=1 Tax=Hoeflea sp. TYP-13 TaxID=3230023 RepID=UPI0034C60621
MSDTVAMPEKAVVQFDCRGTAVGKMRNELAIEMVKPFKEEFELATDEGKFHGGDASAPPPLAMFVGALTGCIMTQIRAFAKRLGVSLNDLKVETRIQWNWQAVDRVYETAPKSFEIDVLIDSPDPDDKVAELIETAKKGCFIEQTLGVGNTINHRMKTADGWRDV